MPSCPGVPQAWYSLNLAWSHHSPWPRINDLFLAIVHLDQDLARVQLLYQRGRTVLFYQEKLPIVFLDVNDLKNSLNLKIQQINSIGWEMLRIHKVLHFQRWRKSQAKSLLAGSIRQPASCCWILLSKPQGSPRYTQLSSKSTSWLDAQTYTVTCLPGARKVNEAKTYPWPHWRPLPTPLWLHLSIGNWFMPFISAHRGHPPEVGLNQSPTTRRRMARERRGAESSVVSMETLYYKIIY